MSSSIRLRTALKAARPSGARIHSIVEDIVSDDGDCSDVRVRKEAGLWIRAGLSAPILEP